MAPPSDTVNVTIFNTPYSLSPLTDPQAPNISELAAYVDAKMTNASERAGIVSSTKVAVLTALEIAQELFELRRATDTANTRINDIIRSIDDTL